MRAIEFRGKRLNNGEWVYGHLVSDGARYFVIYDNDVTECTRYGERYIEVGRYFEVDPETVGMSTNHKDGKVNELYAGDIVISRYNHNFIGVIKFGDHKAYCPLDNLWVTSTGFYIEEPGKTKDAYPTGATEGWAIKIGNIHDNPELLEVEE